MKVYNWFVPTIFPHMPYLSIVMAYALLLVVTVFTDSISKTATESKNKETMLNPFINSAVMLFFAWIVKHYLF